MLWHAMPPELNTARLMAGAGAAPAMQAASGWEALAIALETQADELAASLVLLGESWTGAGSERAVAATTPMVIWLRNVASVAQTRAMQATAQAAAYTQALAMMPSLLEIFANHITHAVLAATNFLGINTMPIGANEADYFIRMWDQAVSAMDVYQVETAANTFFETVEPLQAILDPGISQTLTTAAGQLTAMVSQAPAFAAGALPIQQLPAMSGTMMQLLLPLQQVTSLFSQAGGMGGAGRTTPADDESAQMGLLDTNPLSNHPLAGGSGPSVGAGLLRAEELPGAGGTLSRTPLISQLLDKPVGASMPPAAGAESSAMGGAAPVGAMGQGARSGGSTRPGLVAPVPPVPQRAEEDGDDQDYW
ncbi:PPE domain-containing protein [Mycobacterium simiae]|uniref:PPE domain-containing protein n=1 Tax=Mycobacterium simiae TaxID=1784 RepID=A0A5B1BWK1_MYCSI|nr:PPE family protein [Mycobacterium simiae]KAA1252125.1 PPE domain-containing protein [Mycobacterium simiae]